MEEKFTVETIMRPKLSQTQTIRESGFEKIASDSILYVGILVMASLVFIPLILACTCCLKRRYCPGSSDNFDLNSLEAGDTTGGECGRIVEEELDARVKRRIEMIRMQHAQRKLSPSSAPLFQALRQKENQGSSKAMSCPRSSKTEFGNCKGFQKEGEQLVVVPPAVKPSVSFANGARFNKDSENVYILPSSLIPTSKTLDRFPKKFETMAYFPQNTFQRSKSVNHLKSKSRHTNNEPISCICNYYPFQISCKYKNPCCERLQQVLIHENSKTILKRAMARTN